MQQITLFELNQKVKEVLAQSFDTRYWVIAEISEVKENNSGHCYLELIQKEDARDYPKAKARATIWAYTYRMLKPYFETSTGRILSSGMKVLVEVEVVFHEVYGYSLNITDIEPNYTIGDIEQKRREAIERLVAEGVFDMNKGLELPILPKRVAVISSPTAAGLQDFINQLLNNSFGYVVEHTLFQANMQGNEAENSIIAALDAIYTHQNEFDIAVIIRGGGSQADLACFDSYWVAAHVAQFPLPVLTGIGHDKDVSVVDLVANTQLKTPTAVAEFILGKYYDFEATIEELTNRLKDSALELTNESKLIFEKTTSILAPSVIQSSLKQKIIIERIQSKILLLSSQTLSKQKQRLSVSNNLFYKTTSNFLEGSKSFIEKLENKNTLLNPENILERGYSITLHEGKILFNAKLVAKGSKIKTILHKGEIDSTVA